MMTPSTLASTAGVAIGTALGTAVRETAATGARLVRRAVVDAAKKAKVASTPAKAPARSGASLLLDPGTIKSLSSVLGAILREGATRVGVPGYALAPAPKARTTSSSTSATSSKSALSFLSDPKLSIEEKLMRLLAYLNDKYEKEMQAKMDEIAGKAKTTSSTKAKSGGIFGTVASALSSVVGGDALKSLSGFLKMPGVKSAIGKIAGPVLAAGATALGFPAAAPLLLKYGSKVVDVAAGVVGEAASSASSGTSSAGTTTSGANGKEDQLAMMEIQRLMDKQKEMFGLVSNIIKASHDTRMSTINNIR